MEPTIERNLSIEVEEKRYVKIFSLVYSVFIIK